MEEFHSNYPIRIINYSKDSFIRKDRKQIINLLDCQNYKIQRFIPLFVTKENYQSFELSKLYLIRIFKRYKFTMINSYKWCIILFSNNIYSY